MVALVMALGEYMTKGAPVKSVYEQSGIKKL